MPAFVHEFENAGFKTAQRIVEKAANIGVSPCCVGFFCFQSVRLPN
jgi:hypothetical protein